MTETDAMETVGVAGLESAAREKDLEEGSRVEELEGVARVEDVKLGRNGRQESILDAIGNTPLVRLRRIGVGAGSPVTYWAKLEHLNPSGSVKDRMALFIVEDAERRGLLRPGGTIVENSSGNTGASLAMIAAVKGYRCIITMPDKMSDEKRRIMEAYGAEVVVTPTDVPAESEQSYYSVARRMASEIPGAFYPDQYNNPLNIEAHYRTTGPELWNQSGGEIDALVAGIGTGGTLSGAGRYLKERNPEIQVVAVDPYGSVFFDYWKRGVPGPPHVYKVEGIGEDYLVEAVDFSLIDEMLQVDDRQSFHLTRRLARQEGIFAGGSSGSVLQGALEYGQRFTTPRNVVVLFADSGSRYLSKLYSDRWLSEAGFAAGLHGSTHTGTDGSHSTGEDAAEDTGGNANEYAIEDTGGNANEYATRIQAGMPARRSHELP